jgi:cytochrome P450
MPSTLVRAPRPPVVKSVPFLGPLRPFLGDVLPFLTASRATYGDVFRLRMANVELTCLFGPDAIALLQRDSGLRTSTSMHVLDEEMQSRLPSMIDGPNRQTIRKAHQQFMNHSLESTHRVDIQDWLDQHTQRWEPGVRLDVLSEAQTQTVDVLSRLLNGEPFPFRKRDLALVVHTMIWATFGHAPRLVLRNPAYRSTQRRMRAHLLELVAKIRSDPERVASTLVGHYLDFPAPPELGEWTDSDLVSVPYGAYLAGFDTVASAASFLLYRLLSNPDALDRVRQEHDALSADSAGPVDPAQQKFLRAAFLETVRLNPPGSAVLRFAERDFEFGGYSIRKDDELLVVIAGDHLDAELFPHPTVFDPTRFLQPGAAELKRHVLPFGSGAHRCTGAALGELIAVEMVSNWVSRFDLRLEPGRRGVRATARPYTQPSGLRVRVVGRRDPAGTSLSRGAAWEAAARG